MTDSVVHGNFDTARRKVIDGLLSTLTNRFNDITNGVLKASNITNLNLWPENLSSNTIMK